MIGSPPAKPERGAASRCSTHPDAAPLRGASAIIDTHRVSWPAGRAHHGRMRERSGVLAAGSRQPRPSARRLEEISKLEQFLADLRKPRLARKLPDLVQSGSSTRLLLLLAVHRSLWRPPAQ